MMDRLMKYLRNLAILAALAGIIWGLGRGYWHFNIVTSIKTLSEETRARYPGQIPRFIFPPDAAGAVQDAGSRALPYLSESLTPNKNIAYLLIAGEWIRGALEPAGSARRLRPFTIEDAPQTIEARCREYQQAWRTLGAPKHRAWQWWKATELPPMLSPNE